MYSIVEFCNFEKGYGIFKVDNSNGNTIFELETVFENMREEICQYQIPSQKIILSL